MSINFNTLGNSSTTTPVEVVPSPSNEGISLDLTKDSLLSLDKVAPGLKKVDLCAGWDISSNGTDSDLDISLFLLGENNKISSVNDIIYYKNQNASGVHLHEDNRTGVGDGDDEIISINLEEVSSNVHKIVCCVTIYDAVNRRQTFGMVNNSFVRLVNKENDAELCKFSLKTDSSTDTAVIFAELVRDTANNTWVFHTMGEGKQADLNQLAMLFH